MIDFYHEVYKSLAQLLRPGLTVGFESSRFAVSAACLVDSLDEKDVTSAALQAVDCVVILLDIGHNHPAIYRVIQTCKVRETEHNITHRFSILFLQSLLVRTVQALIINIEEQCNNNH